MSDFPPLSVILATTDPWPDLARCLEVLEPQVSDVGGELIVGDGHGEALPPDHLARSRCVSWIRLPGASVFELRARAAERARSDVVAITEDHCVVAADWCAEILRGFALNPEALGLTGPVSNGSREHLIDWANFLHTFADVLPPCDWKSRTRCPPNANLAYRRSAFPAGALPPGWMELTLNPRLYVQGRFAFHEPMAVTHVQSHGFWRTLRAHFDNGRSTTGLHPTRLSRRQLPWTLHRNTLRALAGRQRRDPVIRASLPLLFLLSCCHALGETIGILAGPGRSPARLR
jgi:hypothetical protein